MSPVPGIGAAPLVLKHLRRVQRTRTRLIEQVASGSRLLRASDGPAQVAIASKMNVRIRSRKAVIRNIRDAQSVLQTADGGLDQIQAVLARLREVTTAAASGHHSAEARVAMMIEAAALATEVDRLALSTKFNGAPLLAQVHVDVGFVIDASGSMGPEKAQVIASIGAMVTAFNDAGLDAQFGLAGVRTTLDPVDNLFRFADIGDPGFMAALSGLPLGGAPVDPYAALLNASGANDFNNDGDPFTWRAETLSHIIYVTDTGQETVLTPGNPSGAQVGAALGLEGVTTHVIAPSSRFPRFVDITTLSGGGLYDLGNSSGDNIPSAMDQIAESMVGSAPEAYGPLSVQIGLDGPPENQLELGVALDSTRVGLGLTGLDLSTATGSGDALDTIDQAIDQISSHRAQVGAMHNRLSYAMGNHETTLVNEVEAGSRLEDLDMAVAVSELRRTEVLQATGALLLKRALDGEVNLMRQLVDTMGVGPPLRRAS